MVADVSLTHRNIGDLGADGHVWAPDQATQLFQMWRFADEIEWTTSPRLPDAGGMTRFALLLSLLAFGTLGLAACDDDETATAETEVITSDYSSDPPGRGAVAVVGGPDACGDYPEPGPGGYSIRIDVTEGVVRCREARRVLKEYYHAPHHTTPPAWYCVDVGDQLVLCDKPGAEIAAHHYCRAWRDMAAWDKAACLRTFGPP